MNGLERLSLGVLLDPQAKQSIAELQMHLKRKSASTELRWTDPNEIFLTICSIGEVGGAAMIRLKTVLGELSGQVQPVSTVLDTLAGTPSALQPRTLHIESSQAEPLVAFSNACRRALNQAVELPAERPDYPHVPIGILRKQDEPSRTAVGRLIRMFKDPIQVPVEVRRVSLLRHSAGPAGPTVGSVFDLDL